VVSVAHPWSRWGVRGLGGGSVVSVARPWTGGRPVAVVAAKRSARHSRSEPLDFGGAVSGRGGWKGLLAGDGVVSQRPGVIVAGFVGRRQVVAMFCTRVIMAIRPPSRSRAELLHLVSNPPKLYAKVRVASLRASQKWPPCIPVRPPPRLPAAIRRPILCHLLSMRQTTGAFLRARARGAPRGSRKIRPASARANQPNGGGRPTAWCGDPPLTALGSTPSAVGSL
jgi:hypothetical protein